MFNGGDEILRCSACGDIGAYAQDAPGYRIRKYCGDYRGRIYSTKCCLAVLNQAIHRELSASPDGGELPLTSRGRYNGKLASLDLRRRSCGGHARNGRDVQEVRLRNRESLRG